MIDRFRRAKILVRYGVGPDNVDVSAATRRAYRRHVRLLRG